MADLEDDADSQDLAEVFDETNITRDGVDIAHPDMAPDVYDVTVADDDADEDEFGGEDPGGGDDFDPDDLDEAELEAMLEEDDGIDEAADAADGGADRVSSDDPSPADYQG
jgi:hypothetical protein